MATVVIGFAQLFTDFGVSGAIIHRRDPTKEELSTLYWLSMLFGISIFLLVELCTPLLVQLFREPALTGPLRLIGLVFLISPFGQQHQVLLQKALRFRALSICISAGYIANAIVAIWLAILGFGVYGLVVGQLVNAVVRAVMLMGAQWGHWKPMWHFDVKSVSGYLSFGLYQTGDRAANFFNVYLAHALIGSLLGARVLGYYTLAFELAYKPLDVITPIISRVAFPIFAIARDDRSRVRRGYMRILRVLSAVNMPLSLGLAVAAPVAVNVLYGEQWSAAVPLAQVLAIVALLRSSGTPVGSLLLGFGRADLGFYWSATKMLLQLPGIYVGIRFGGAFGAALAFLLLQIVFSIVAYAFLIRRLLGPCGREYILSFIPSLVVAFGVAGLVYVTALLGADLSPISLLVAEMGVGLVAYVGLQFAFNRPLISDSLRLLRDGR